MKMRYLSTLTFAAVLISQAHSAPQFINFKEGKLGVNFGGYQAAVGLGGLLGQNGGAGGGLFAEAGTPFGQAAKAGLGGAVDNGGSAGGLYAGATAGGNVKAESGLAGGVIGEKSAGAGFASAQAGNHYASSGLGGDTSNSGSSGFSFSGTKSFGVTNGQVDSSVLDVKPIQAEHKKVHKEFNFDAANDVNFTPLSSGANVEFQKDVTVRTENRPHVIVKEEEVSNVPNVYSDRGRYSNDNYLSFLFRVPTVNYGSRVWWTPYYPSIYKNSQVYIQPPRVVEKHIIHKHTKPRHHFRTTVFGGFNGGNDGIQTISQPAIQKRIDVGVDAGVNAGAAADAGINGNIGHTYTKQVTFQRNPNFFADIFNIPISTLKAVGNFLGNTAGSTSVSVQKSGSIHADSDLITPKHAAASSVSSSDAHNISVQTPNVSKVIDDILAIPINTLGAVNKFLENNVPARKTVQVSEDGTVEPVRRLGPHARRRANKQVVILEEENVQKTEKSS